VYNHKVDTPLLTSKLEFPLKRANLVPRSRLIENLNNNLFVSGVFSRKLTLVSAPAGYGKTTVVTEWLANLKSKTTHSQIETGGDISAGDGFDFAWLSLDEKDNDPALFLKYLIAAFKRNQGNFGSTLEPLFASPQSPPAELLLTALISELSALPSPTILILDDYHFIHSPPIHQQLGFIIEHLPRKLHLVILTREDPLLPIPRLRVAGLLQEIRQEDLRFTESEAQDFIGKTMGLSLTKEDIAKLERRTEGWIAGLQMAALSMQGRDDHSGFVQAFTGSNRYILDYLIEEVIERVSDGVQEFLLKTSILDRLTAPQCEAVSGCENCQEILETLEDTNLFIVPLDQSRIWFRYHRLFAELLRHRLRVTSSYSESELHKRASKWFAGEGLISDAVHHAITGEDWENAAHLIGEAGDALLKRGELVTLINWYQKIPPELIHKHPDFGLTYAWGLLLLGKFEEGEQLLTYFENIGKDIPELMGQVATAQAYAARANGDNERVIEKSQIAMELLPESEITSRSNLALNLGLVYWHEGQLREAVQVMNEALELATQVENHYAALTAQVFLARTLASQGVLRGAEERLRKMLDVGEGIPILVLVHYDLSNIYYEWNDLRKAWEHAEKGLEICTRSGNREFQNAGHILKALILMAQGNMLGSLAEAETSHALSQEFGIATRARSFACHAQIALRMGDTTTAEHWVDQMPIDVDAHSFYRFSSLIHPRLMLAQGERLEAASRLDDLLSKATESGWGFAVIAIMALQALAAETKKQGVRILNNAMLLSQPEGFIRTYVDAGSDLIPLLKEAAHQGIMPDYVGQILRAFGDKRKMESVSPLVEPLSKRELEVLRLVAAGLSNKEIAEKLYLSPGTIKTHVHNICGKLGARNRTEAATRAKEINLI